jgi:hypothetical protein
MQAIKRFAAMQAIKRFAAMQAIKRFAAMQAIKRFAAAGLAAAGAALLASAVVLAGAGGGSDSSQLVGGIVATAAPNWAAEQGNRKAHSITNAGAVRVHIQASESGASSISSITTSVTPGTGAAHLGKAEDAAHVSGDTGVLGLGVANTDGTDLVNAAGDYVPQARTLDGAAKTLEQVGVLIDETGAVLTISRQRGVTNLAAGAEVEIRAAQGAGVEVIVVGWILSVDAATTLRFESDDGAETAIGPDVYLAANGGWTSDYTQLWFETASNGALELENGGAVAVNVGWTVYTVQR